MAALTQKPIKVDRLKLIAALEGAVKNGDEGYRRAMDIYDARLERCRLEILSQLERVVAKPALLKLNLPYRDGTVHVDFGSKTELPAKPRDTQCDLRNTIAVLRLGDDPSVTISAEQYGAYFPCEVD